MASRLYRSSFPTTPYHTAHRADLTTWQICPGRSWWLGDKTRVYTSMDFCTPALFWIRWISPEGDPPEITIMMELCTEESSGRFHGSLKTGSTESIWRCFSRLVWTSWALYTDFRVMPRRHIMMTIELHARAMDTMKRASKFSWR